MCPVIRKAALSYMFVVAFCLLRKDELLNPVAVNKRDKIYKRKSVPKPRPDPPWLIIDGNLSTDPIIMTELVKGFASNMCYSENTQTPLIRKWLYDLSSFNYKPQSHSCELSFYIFFHYLPISLKYLYLTKLQMRSLTIYSSNNSQQCLKHLSLKLTHQL